jgi:hypothetical protein
MKASPPLSGITKFEIGIETLCDSITESSIIGYGQPHFPNWQTDSLTVSRLNLRGFLRVVNEAFYNELPPSDAPGPDFDSVMRLALE